MENQVWDNLTTVTSRASAHSVAMIDSPLAVKRSGFWP
jgi:hypothetical protein